MSTRFTMTFHGTVTTTSKYFSVHSHTHTQTQSQAYDGHGLGHDQYKYGRKWLLTLLLTDQQTAIIAVINNIIESERISCKPQNNA